MTNTQPVQDSTIHAWLEPLHKAFPRGEPGWLQAIRRAALEQFVERGFPTTRDEEWRFTNVAPIARQQFQPARTNPAAVTPEMVSRFTFGCWQCHTLVFVNGVYEPALSSRQALPAGVVAQGLGHVLKHEPAWLEPHLARYARIEQQAFVALNTALMEDGAFVYIPAGVVVDAPIHLLFISTADEPAALAQPRNLIVVEANAQVNLIESYVGLDGGIYFTNAVTEIVAGDRAVIDHYKLQRESLKAFHVATLQVSQGRQSSVSTHSISLGGRLVRNDVNVVLAGEGCDCTLNGSYMVKDHQHVDNHTLIDHAQPHGTSRELYKGILDDHASGVFNGRIIVRPGAQKTDARQTNKNLLLSEDALVNTNPQLEIHADDVKCTHGATIGQLDADALYYLRARGIDLETARHILTYAFASDILSRIKIAPIRTGLECGLFMNVPHGHTTLEEL
ncbi:MAG: Fe-S cluster assembly protein SufD [Acidobacteriota bacterium]|nr:Fe-S cluster assembly protein SufD [Acidobacteriota bacterium]